MNENMILRDTKKLKVWWDEKNSIACYRGKETVDEMTARVFLETVNLVAQKFGDEIVWLADMSGITKSTSKGRKLVAEAIKHPSIKVLAMYGASVFVRTVSNFINAAAGINNAKHFSNKEDALEWIKVVVQDSSTI